MIHAAPVAIAVFAKADPTLAGFIAQDFIRKPVARL